jgi:hypothetical protein
MSTEAPPGLSKEANEVLDFLAGMPQWAHRAVPQKMMREILLHTEGEMYLRGYTWDVKTKRLGAGIHKIWLERQP